MMNLIQLLDINTTAGTQTRINIDESVVSEYAERMQEGDVFPPVVVFHDGTTHYLADGFHRVMAASRIEFVEIDAEILKGTRQDAIWYSIGANRTNGKRMEPGDKRNAILIALREFPEKSQQEIAEQVGCSHVYVGKVKKDNVTSYNIPPTRTDSLGRTRPTSYAKPQPPIEPDTAPEEPPQPRETQAYEKHPVSDAMYFVSIAISQMERIRNDDPNKHEAFDKMGAWLQKNK